MNKHFLLISIFTLCFVAASFAQQDSTIVYKKRVLEKTEIDFLSSYYSQDGDNAAVTGGIGTEELTDITAAFVVRMPLNDDDVLTIDLGLSAYTSASTSNINPFDGGGIANPFQASSGASESDLWVNLTGIYSHSSDDRNQIWTAKISGSVEYDYFSIGLGGSFTKLFNQKNTEVSITGNVFLDTWNDIYPFELRPFGDGGNGLNDDLFTQNTITGNPNYNPLFEEFNDVTRNTFSLGLGFSQILSKNVQVSLLFDVIQQDGLLSTPFHRINFADIDDSFIEEFHLADAIETLPDTRLKLAFGGRLNYYINETFIIRTYYRYYTDDWGIDSHTASIEIPIKISQKFTLYPSYRYYTQTQADYFAPYETHLSTAKYYTSDYDLSEYDANQFGFGVSYKDVFAKFHIWKFGLKSIDLKYNNYDRDNSLSSNIISAAFKFVMD
jgi:hypothetical protein